MQITSRYRPPGSAVTIGELVGEKYQIESILSTGSIVTIYAAKMKVNTGAELLAIKIEKDEVGHAALSREAVAIEAIKNSKHFARVIECGMHRELKFMATDLLGPNLNDLISRRPPYKMAMNTILKFAIQAFEALQSLHQAGFIHCAVEAKNFLIGNTKQTANNFYLIDFSKCRKFNFNDTSREPTPEGDLFGVMKIILDQFSLKNFAEDQLAKELQKSFRQLHNIPSKFRELHDAIMSFQPQQTPDYHSLIRMLDKIALRKGIDMSEPFEWEIEMNMKRKIVLHNYYLNFQDKEREKLINQKQKDQNTTIPQNEDVRIEMGSSSLLDIQP
ncbi:MAG: putative protein serine/threonine kinase, partial [Streblomastix strix]